MEGDFTCYVYFKCFVDSEQQKPKVGENRENRVIFPEKCSLTSMDVGEQAFEK